MHRLRTSYRWILAAGIIGFSCWLFAYVARSPTSDMGKAWQAIAAYRAAHDGEYPRNSKELAKLTPLLHLAYFLDEVPGDDRITELRPDVIVLSDPRKYKYYNPGGFDHHAGWEYERYSECLPANGLRAHYYFLDEILMAQRAAVKSQGAAGLSYSAILDFHNSLPVVQSPPSGGPGSEVVVFSASSGEPVNVQLPEELAGRFEGVRWYMLPREGNLVRNDDENIGLVLDGRHEELWSEGPVIRLAGERNSCFSGKAIIYAGAPGGWPSSSVSAEQIYFCRQTWQKEHSDPEARLSRRPRISLRGKLHFFAEPPIVTRAADGKAWPW